MSVISKRTKGKTVFETTRATAKRPQLLMSGAKIALPAGEARAEGEQAAAQATSPAACGAARQSFTDARRRACGVRAEGGVRPRARRAAQAKRTAPRVAAGMVIGASAVYFLEPGHSTEHREKVAQLVS